MDGGRTGHVWGSQQVRTWAPSFANVRHRVPEQQLRCWGPTCSKDKRGSDSSRKGQANALHYRCFMLEATDFVQYTTFQQQ
eukprot:scaffold232940_cov24-Tisochrysis_lutea.AAC.2